MSTVQLISTISAAFLLLSMIQQAIATSSNLATKIEYTTINFTVTVWIDKNGKPLATMAEGGMFTGLPSFASNLTPTISVPSSEIQNSVSVGVPPSSKIKQTLLPSTNESASTEIQTFTSFVSLPVSSEIPVFTSSVSLPISTQKAAVSTLGSSGGVTGSSTSSCEGKSNACVGDVTHWDGKSYSAIRTALTHSGGLGACGWNVKTSSVMQIALPVGLMGSQSNGKSCSMTCMRAHSPGNPYCGRSLTIQNPSTGQTVQATVGDKCMGCTGRSIDLTDALFNTIASNCDGRCSGFVWWFN